MRSLTLLATAAVLGACSSENREQATIDSASGSLAPATAGTLADTGMGSMGAVSGAPSSTGSASGASGSAAPKADSANSDSANRGSASRDSSSRSAASRGNQNQSGVTDTKTGASTLGPDAMKTRPDQGKATTSKGDTVTRAQPPR